MPALLEPATLPPITSHRITLDPRHTGRLRDSSDALSDLAMLRERMNREGYLYLPGLLNKDWVMDARRTLTDMLAEAGHLDTRFPSIDAIAKPGGTGPWIGHGDERLKSADSTIHRLLYTGNMMHFFTQFLNGAVRHYDFTWYRIANPGYATQSHCDIVYMGRGTPNVYTAWTPLGDVPLEEGGLMLLEGSNCHERLKNTYGKKDVDAFCTNKTGAAAKDGWHAKHGGGLATDANQIRRSLGGRWLTTDFHAGDVLIFSMFTVHASVDNCSNRVRLSTDSRYQLASEPADERWIGENPPAHSQAGKRGRIC